MPDWILLIYTVPSQPSRKRAFVWRELKKLGAVYLRDGVAVLPRQADLEERVQTIAARVVDYEGTADVIPSPFFSEARQEQLRQRFQDERACEYREIHHACIRFLRDVLEDVRAEDFGFPDVDNLDSELARLHRWHEQILERDYFGAPGSHRVKEILEKCDRAFEQFASTASAQVDGAIKEPPEDVFERLGGAGNSGDDVPDDYPL